MKTYIKLEALLLVIMFHFASVRAQQMYVHDPVMIKSDGTYHLFCTFKGIASFSSDNLIDWKYTGPVFDQAPDWTVETITDFKGHFWAPDILYHEGLYYIYYSVSSFGKNTSCIGVATNTTLDTSAMNYHWEDQGMVVQSVPGRDLWNAIDPNIAFDDQGDAWMTFGSFWEGMKLVKLDSTLLRIEKPEQWYTIARRERSFEVPDRIAGDAPIEAPFIFKKNGYYYLFVSFDYCCRGVESTYKIMVGRSKNISGPYVDKDGVDMFLGGGSLVLEGDNRYQGLGHNSAYTFDDQDYLVFHAYDSEDEGKPILRIMKIDWDEEKWPVPTKDLDVSRKLMR